MGARITQIDPAEAWDRLDFAATLAAWIEDWTGLISGLATLRTMGEDGQDAVDEILAIRTVQRARLSWALWEVMAEQEGVDTDDLLSHHLSNEVLAWARYALLEDAEPV